VQSIAGVTVNAVSYTLMDSSHQSGNVYSVNLTKGYIEFPTAPAAAATISVGYNHYTTAQTSCPADQILYLLTDKLRGKGIDSSRIDFASFVAFQTYCNASITVQGATGEVTQARYAANYVVDDRKPFQDHIQAILDVCNGALVLSNGKFVIVPRSGGSSVFDFDSSNILVNSNGLSSLQPELLDRSTRANRIKVLFSSDASLNSEDGAVADDTANQDDRVGRIGNNGVVEDNLKFPALADPDQAQRLANQLVAEQVRSNWLYTWKTNIQGLALQPGDLVTVTHDATLFYPPAPTLMRIESLDYDEEDILTIVASQYVSDAYL